MHYIIWLSSRGGKEVYTITDSQDYAKWLVNWLNKEYRERNAKARAYATICEEGRPYYHKEIKEWN